MRLPRRSSRLGRVRLVSACWASQYMCLEVSVLWSVDQNTKWGFQDTPCTAMLKLHSIPRFLKMIRLTVTQGESRGFIIGSADPVNFGKINEKSLFSTVLLWRCPWYTTELTPAAFFSPGFAPVVTRPLYYIKEYARRCILFWLFMLWSLLEFGISFFLMDTSSVTKN